MNQDNITVLRIFISCKMIKILILFFPSPNKRKYVFYISQINTQVGIQDITIEKEQRCSIKKQLKKNKGVPLKNPREVFIRKDDTLFMQSWLNVSKNPSVGVDKKTTTFG